MTDGLGAKATAPFTLFSSVAFDFLKEATGAVVGALDAVWLAVAMFIARRISQNIVVHRGVTNRLNHAPHLPQPPTLVLSSGLGRCSLYGGNLQRRNIDLIHALKHPQERHYRRTVDACTSHHDRRRKGDLVSFCDANEGKRPGLNFSIDAMHGQE